MSPSKFLTRHRCLAKSTRTKASRKYSFLKAKNRKSPTPTGRGNIKRRRGLRCRGYKDRETRRHETRRIPLSPCLVSPCLLITFYCPPCCNESALRRTQVFWNSASLRSPFAHRAAALVET